MALAAIAWSGHLMPERMALRKSHRIESTVYVLGAGASHEAGVPLANQILPAGWAMFDALRRSRPVTTGYLARLDRSHATMFRRVYDFIARVFQGRRSAAQLDLARLPLLEELWALIEMAHEDRATFGPALSTDTVAQVRNALMALMYHALVGARVRYDATGRGAGYRVDFSRRSNPYSRFVRRLDPADAIIVLNYDTLLDRALVHDGWAIEYGVGTTVLRDRSAPSIPLLKLHGSFNWLYCPSCRTVEDHGPVDVAHVPLERGERAVRCPRDGARREPVIVPPSLVRSRVNPHLQRVWNEAAARLRTCSRLVFMGYAMSESDVHVRYLVKQATSLNPMLTSTARRSHTPRITAVDTSAEGLASYERLFGPGRVDCVRGSFRRYVDERMTVRG